MQPTGRAPAAQTTRACGTRPIQKRETNSSTRPASSESRYTGGMTVCALQSDACDRDESCHLGTSRYDCALEMEVAQRVFSYDSSVLFGCTLFATGRGGAVTADLLQRHLYNSAATTVLRLCYRKGGGTVLRVPGFTHVHRGECRALSIALTCRPQPSCLRSGRDAQPWARPNSDENEHSGRHARGISRIASSAQSLMHSR